MTDSGMNSVSQPPIEATLADQLARGDVVLGAAGPMLGMLVLNRDSALFSDEVVARVRGMCRHVAQQLAAGHGAPEDGEGDTAGKSVRLAEALSGEMAFLSHCHALALEHRFAMRLERDYALSSAVSPMLEALIASSDVGMARLATAVAAAQARFEQQQRRAELPVMELPPMLFERALVLAREHGADLGGSAEHLRDGYDPRRTRLALLLRIVEAAGGEPSKALSLHHAGAGLFLSALAAATGQDRDLVAMTTSDSQAGRLILALRAAGLTADRIAQEFTFIHPGMPAPNAADMPDAERALAALAASGRQAMG